MSRLRARLTRLEQRRAPKNFVYVLYFDPAGMSREEIRAEVARRRGVDPSEITLARGFFIVPEPIEDTQEWLAKYAPGGTEWARWGK